MDRSTLAAELGDATQVGILVRDAHRSAELMSAITGIGPWSFEDWPPPNRPEFESFSDDRPARWRARLAFARSGSTEVELIETYEGECGYTQYVRERGPGIHHLQFRVKDVDAAARRLTDRGIKIKMGATGRRPGTKWVLMDTYEQLGFYVELTSL